MREFGAGVALLVRGFAFWKRRPGVMALGLLPAGIVGLLVLAGLLTLVLNLGHLTTAATPFAEDWPGQWTAVARVAVGTAMLGAALVVVAVSFTALTLIVGEPFYDRIWRAVEKEADGRVPESNYGIWQSAADGLTLFARGLGVALLAGVAGFIPVVGGACGAVLGVTLTGWLLADELSSRALSARGLSRAERRALLRGRRARALGFGVATQLCFLVPLGAVAVMPAAVAGSTMLARSALPSPAR